MGDVTDTPDSEFPVDNTTTEQTEEQLAADREAVWRFLDAPPSVVPYAKKFEFLVRKNAALALAFSDAAVRGDTGTAESAQRGLSTINKLLRTIELAWSNSITQAMREERSGR